MIATELAARYTKGESLNALAREYHLCKRTIARVIRAMGGEIRPAGGGSRGRIVPNHAAEMRRHKAHDKKMATGEYCVRCEILLRFDPGRDGYCGECVEEVSHAVVSTLALHCSDSDLPGEASHGARVQREELEDVV